MLESYAQCLGESRVTDTGRHDCLSDHEENSDTKSVCDTSMTEPCVINCACYGA